MKESVDEDSLVMFEGGPTWKDFFGKILLEQIGGSHVTFKTFIEVYSDEQERRQSAAYGYNEKEKNALGPREYQARQNENRKLFLNGSPYLENDIALHELNNHSMGELFNKVVGGLEASWKKIGLNDQEAKKTFEGSWFNKLCQGFRNAVDREKMFELLKIAQKRGNVQSLLDSYNASEAALLSIKPFIHFMGESAGYGSEENFLLLMERLQKSGVRNFGREIQQAFEKDPNLFIEFKHGLLERISQGRMPWTAVGDVIKVVVFMLNNNEIDEKFKTEIKNSLLEKLMSKEKQSIVHIAVQSNSVSIEAVGQIIPGYIFDQDYIRPLPPRPRPVEREAESRSENSENKSPQPVVEEKPREVVQEKPVVVVYQDIPVFQPVVDEKQKPVVKKEGPSLTDQCLEEIGKQFMNDPHTATKLIQNYVAYMAKHPDDKSITPQIIKGYAKLIENNSGETFKAIVDGSPALSDAIRAVFSVNKDQIPIEAWQEKKTVTAPGKQVSVREERELDSKLSKSQRLIKEKLKKTFRGNKDSQQQNAAEKNNNDNNNNEKQSGRNFSSRK